ncbi:hypothetical protein [Hymenobacter weizhouensis]|uniref:hypothetical protein n=1 Tax=Hymenobacter sp. YIM 151500-1 TaxID=2987689 RepID=UPI002226B54F|nr:hypothetical protein [Hymenobacter sp. YIM 151500-1]UYZ63415.1 hypothetical protein OIS53_00885 [Hymenobacter sp. YIM 151500-1]
MNCYLALYRQWKSLFSFSLLAVLATGRSKQEPTTPKAPVAASATADANGESAL